MTDFARPALTAATTEYGVEEKKERKEKREKRAAKDRPTGRADGRTSGWVGRRKPKKLAMTLMHVHVPNPTYYIHYVGRACLSLQMLHGDVIVVK